MMQDVSEQVAVDHPWSKRKRCIVAGVVLAAATVIVLVVVAVAVVARANDNGENIGTVSPNSTMAPTPSQPWDDDVCFSTTRSLMNNVFLARQDYSVFADIELCPRTTFRVESTHTISRNYDGEKDENGANDSQFTFKDQQDTVDHDLISGSSPGLPAQSNMRIKCGPSGALTDRCLLVGNGDYLVINSKFTFLEVAATNVTYEGLTFQSGKNFLQMLNGGDITFRNCVFQDATDFTPFIIDHQVTEDENPLIRQTITFEGCIFEGIQYGPPNEDFVHRFMTLLRW